MKSVQSSVFAKQAYKWQTFTSKILLSTDTDQITLSRDNKNDKREHEKFSFVFHQDFKKSQNFPRSQNREPQNCVN